MNKKELLRKFDFQEPYAIAFQNPVTTSPEETIKSTESILKALDEINILTVIIYPNSDPGSENIIQIISRYKNKSNFRIYNNLSSREYLSLLKYCLFLIGNSTSGIIEAPIFNIPFINVGTRQRGRDSADNLILLKRWDKNSIKKTIEKIMKRTSKFICKRNPYSQGGASEKIVKVLRDINLNERLFKKGYHSLLK
jgi:UDP-hydrolysing UDP-N-acetyl-D-glucosamine 2-epimerase